MSIKNELEGRVVVVTGGSGGIGKRLGRAYLKAGAKVVLASRSESKLDDAMQELKSIDGEVLAIPTDVTDTDSVDNLVSKTVSSYGKLDVLVNNAGGAMFIKSPLDLKKEEWSAAIDLNLTSVFLCSQRAVPEMIKAGGGRIINVSSVAGIRMSPAFVHYGAAKAGVINLTKSLASCWGGYKINVNCIAPGLTATEGVADWLPPKSKKDGTPVPMLEYPPDPEHVADLAVFLSGEGSQHITGELFPIRALTELA